MELITIRIEAILKDLIQKMADSAGRNISDVTRDLIDLGIGYKQEAPITLKGAFGLARSFSKLSFGDEKTRMSFWIEKKQTEKAMNFFQNTKNGSIREAIRLGFIMFHADSVKITNPFIEISPFKKFKLMTFNNKKAQQAYKNLRKRV